MVLKMMSDRPAMVMGQKIFELVLASAVIASGGEALAKRVPPKAVAAVVANGVRYQVPHFGALHGKAQNGGYVQAWDVKSGKLLWDRMVYRVRYDENLEKDVQDDFISRIAVRKGHLTVQTERSERFDMDLGSGAVRALTPLGSHIEVADPNP